MIIAFVAEKTGWTINEILDLTPQQLLGLLENWTNVEKPSKEKAEKFNAILRSI